MQSYPFVFNFWAINHLPDIYNLWLNCMLILVVTKSHIRLEYLQVWTTNIPININIQFCADDKTPSYFLARIIIVFYACYIEIITSGRLVKIQLKYWENRIGHFGISRYQTGCPNSFMCKCFWFIQIWNLRMGLDHDFSISTQVSDICWKYFLKIFHDNISLLYGICFYCMVESESELHLNQNITVMVISQNGNGPNILLSVAHPSWPISLASTLHPLFIIKNQLNTIKC